MEDVAKQLIVSFATALGGAIMTGVVWLAKAIYRAQKDLNAAHKKLREIEKLLKKE